MTFGVGNVLATTVRVWARNLPRFFLLTLVCYLPIIAFNLVLSIDAIGNLWFDKVLSKLMDVHPMLQYQTASLDWIPIAALSAAIALCTVGDLRDERISIWRALGATLRRLAWIVGVALVIRLATTGVTTVVEIIRWDERALFRSTSMLEWAIQQVYWILAMTILIAALPAAIAERRSVFASIRRSWALARGEWLKVFAVKLVHSVFLWAIYYGVSWVLLFSSDTSAEYGRKFVIYAYVRFGIELFVVSIGMVLAAVIYERLRASKEGAMPNQLQRVFD